MVTADASMGKIEQVTRRRDADVLFEDIGLSLLIFFVILTITMTTGLVLFAVGFFMAVTHWCDRLAQIIIIK